MKENQANNFEFQKDWCVTILQFMSDEYSDDARCGGRSYKDFFKGKIDAILNHSGFTANHRRGMKMAYNDVNSSALDHTKNIEELNKILKEKFGKSLTGESILIRKKIDKIIKRGKIVDEVEFYLAKEYIDEFINNNEIELANKLDSILLEFGK